MFTIYEIQNTVTGFKYIGCSKHVQKRWKGHARELNCNKHGNEHLQNAWNKYGQEIFNFEIVAEYNNETTMFLEEKRLIENSQNLYNIAEGGLGGDRFKGLSEKQLIDYKQKLSEAAVRRYKDPAERLKANCFANLSKEDYNAQLEVWSKVKKGSGNGRYKHNLPVIQIDPKTKEVVKIWTDACEAAEAGYNRKYIVWCCQNKEGFKSHKGYSWKWQV
jgi:group I intron endonuclease